MARILVADDESGIRAFIVDTLQDDGHTVIAAPDGDQAAAQLDASVFDLVITDLKMPGQSGIDLLRKVRDEQPETQVIVLTAHGSVETAVEAMKLGAFEYLQKPLYSPDELSLLVMRALERRAWVDLKERHQKVAGTGPPLTHGDPAMRPVLDAIEKVARTTATVLLLGESGTGKEVVAQTIHALGDRAAGPFMAINCAALSESLLESELFGHEKGAFTGATERRRGRLELASGGTFFLDEIGEMKPELQAKLLRVIQERRFERVGGTHTLEADVRWIAATNRDLRSMMDAGTFREDLYHRLAVFPIRLPPLRDRPNDIVPIARGLLARIAHDVGRPELRLSDAACAKLMAWTWPGNVRELANALERAAILTDGRDIGASHIWLEGAGATAAAAQASLHLADVERDTIQRALQAVGGNRKKAADLLGIGERTLYDKLKRYGID